MITGLNVLGYVLLAIGGGLNGITLHDAKYGEHKHLFIKCILSIACMVSGAFINGMICGIG